MIKFDIWIMLSVFFLVTGTTLFGYSIWYAEYRTFSWGSFAIFVVGVNIHVGVAVLATLCGLISFFKNGKKFSSLLIVVLCILIGAAPIVYFKFLQPVSANKDEVENT